MGTALDLTAQGNSMTLAAARLPGTGLEPLSLDTTVSSDPWSTLQQIACEVILRESRLPGFESLAEEL